MRCNREMSYHPFETIAKKILREKYPNFIWFKLSSQHHVDLLGVGMETKIQQELVHVSTHRPMVRLVEVKYTKAKKYYFKSSPSKRLQLQSYLDEAEKFESLGYKAGCYLLVRVNKRTHHLQFTCLEDLPTFIQ